MSPVTDTEARQAAEAARSRSGHSRASAKELFLGNFQLDLIHPHPVPTDEQRRKGEAFLAKLEDFLRTEVDPLVTALALAGSAHSALSSLPSAHQSIGVPEPLTLFGTDSQKKRFLSGPP